MIRFKNLSIVFLIESMAGVRIIKVFNIEIYLSIYITIRILNYRHDVV